MNRLKRILWISILLVFTMNMYAEEVLTVYIYDSMGWIEEKLVSEFEENNDCRVKIVKFDASGKILSRMKLEKRRPKADVVIGLTPVQGLQARKENLLTAYEADNLKNIQDQSLIFDTNYYLTPYDYGALALVLDPVAYPDFPKNFNELTNMPNSLIIQDPRTSTTGQDFFLWTVAVYGDQWRDYWKDLKNAVLTVTPGWSESFTKFEAQEAPMMISYATDGAYSHHYYQSSKYSAVIPDEGGFVQLEGAGIVKGTKHKNLAEEWIEWMLTRDFQEEIPLNQWMFPVLDIPMPKAYRYAVKPQKKVEIDYVEVSEKLEGWLKEWENIMY